MACVLPALVFLVLLVTSAASHSTGQNTKQWYHHCSDNKYTVGSSYKESLEALSATMPKRASSSPKLFASGAFGSHRKKQIVYAVAECIRDTNSSYCQTCVAAGFEEAHLVCPFSKEVLIYSDLCSIGFAERKFQFYLADGNLVAEHADGPTVSSHCTKYNMAVSRLITDVADTAAHSSEKFAERRKALNEDGCRYTLYALAQCSPILTDEQCHICLQDLIAAPGLSGYVGGRKSALWCSYRFEPLFFEISPGKGDETVWIAVGATVSGLVMILSLITITCRRKRRLTQEKSSSADENLGSQSKASDEGGFGVPRGEPTAQKNKCPSAFDCLNEIKTITQGRKIVIFLDYDGTLSPIVRDYDKAFMPADMRDAVRRAAELFPTSVVSGRSVEKLEEFICLDELHYSGSHGFETKMSYETELYKPFKEYEVFITEATHALKEAVIRISGASVENNVYCVSVHYRNVEVKEWGLVEDCVKEISVGFPQLRQTRGKMVIELRPNVKWDKGDAVRYILQELIEKLQLDRSQVVPIYIGDDLTDEDAFKVLRAESDGFGILVSQEPRITEAYYSVRDTTEVREFLTWLVGWWNANPEGFTAAAAASEDSSDEIVVV